MVYMVDPEDNVVDVPDELYYYMIDRGYGPYLGSQPVPMEDPEGPNDGDIARFNEATRKFLPSPLASLADDVVAHPSVVDGVAALVNPALASKADLVDGEVPEAQLPGHLSDSELTATIETSARTPFPAGLTGERYYDLTAGIYNDRGHLAGVKEAIDRSRLTGGGLYRIACIGHSNVAGPGPSTPGVRAWPDRLRAILTQKGVIKAGTGMVVANNGSSQWDARYTVSAGWTTFTTSSHAKQTNAAGNTVTFVSDAPGTIVDIYTFNSTTPMTVTIDGVAKADVVGSGAGSAARFSYTGLANTTHTVVVTSTAGGCFLTGMEVRNADGLSLSNLGIGGATAGNWTSTPYWDAAATVRLLAPTLTFIQIQVNDAQLGYLADQWAADVTTIVGIARESGAAIIVIDPTPNPVAIDGYQAITDQRWQEYRQAALDVSDTLHVPVLDLSEIFGSHARGKQLGWMLDSVHPTVVGSEVIARAAADMLL